MKSHLLGYILPGLALYQTLLEENGGDRQAALEQVNRLFRASTLHRTRLLPALFRILPDPFPLFKRAFTTIMKAYPPEGWDFTPVEISDQRIAFNATRCYYLDTLTAYGAPELTASFCKMDEVMAENFPPQIRFVRQHTLGQGDAACDFQYCHVRD